VEPVAVRFAPLVLLLLLLRELHRAEDKTALCLPTDFHLLATGVDGKDGLCGLLPGLDTPADGVEGQDGMARLQSALMISAEGVLPRLFIAGGVEGNGSHCGVTPLVTIEEGGEDGQLPQSNSLGGDTSTAGLMMRLASHALGLFAAAAAVLRRGSFANSAARARASSATAEVS